MQTVSNLSALKALTTSDVSSGDTVFMEYRDEEHDGGGGDFVVQTGVASSNQWVNGFPQSGTGTGVTMVADNGVVVDNTAGNLSFVRPISGVVNSAWYGANPSKSAADNASAFGTMFNFYRSRIYGLNTEENAGAFFTPPGVYKSGSINATKIRGPWTWMASGVTIDSEGDGITSIDLTHSRQYRIEGLVLNGDGTNTPRVGFQMGYMQDAVSAGLFKFSNVHSRGHFALAPFFNGGGEEIEISTCQFENELNSTDSYCVVQDGWNYWGKRSEFITRSAGGANHIAQAISNITLSGSNPVEIEVASDTGWTTGDKVIFHDLIGTDELNDNFYEITKTGSTTFTLNATNSQDFSAYQSGGYVNEIILASFVQSRFSNVSVFKKNGGPAAWNSSNITRHSWVSSYMHSLDNDAFIVAVIPEIQQLYPQGLHLDIGFEGSNLQHAVKFARTGSDILTITMGGFRLKDHGPQTDAALIGTDDSTQTENDPGTIYEFVGAHIEVDNFTGTSSKVVDNPTKYRFGGDFISRNNSAISSFPSPFFGRLMIPDANVSELPKGSFEIVSGEFNGSVPTYSINKGTNRFYGSDKNITSGNLSTEKYTQLNGEALVLPKLNKNPALVDGTLFYRDDVLKFYDGSFNQAVAAGPFLASNLGPHPGERVKSVDIPGVSAIAMVSTNGGSGPHALVWVRGTTAAANLFSTPQAGVVITTGPLSATADGVWTISANSDGKMYIRNGTSTPQAVAVTWLAVT